MYSATLILVLVCTQGDAFFRGSEVERPVLLSRLGVSCAAFYPACTTRSWRTSAERPLAPRQGSGMWASFQPRSSWVFLSNSLHFSGPWFSHLWNRDDGADLACLWNRGSKVKWRFFCNLKCILRPQGGVRRSSKWRHTPGPEPEDTPRPPTHTHSHEHLPLVRMCCRPLSNSLGPTPLEGKKLCL